MFFINGGLDIMFFYFFFPIEFFLFLFCWECVKKEMSRVLLTSCGLRFGGYIGRHECLSASDIYGQS